jgi:hypothetical protein
MDTHAAGPSLLAMMAPRAGRCVAVRGIAVLPAPAAGEYA